MYFACHFILLLSLLQPSCCSCHMKQGVTSVPYCPCFPRSRCSTPTQVSCWLTPLLGLCSHGIFSEGFHYPLHPGYLPCLIFHHSIYKLLRMFIYKFVCLPPLYLYESRNWVFFVLHEAPAPKECLALLRYFKESR